MSARVWTYSGHDYASSPRALSWEGERLTIEAILDRWRAPGKKGFRVRTEDKGIFELVYDEFTEEWLVKQTSN